MWHGLYHIFFKGCWGGVILELETGFQCNSITFVGRQGFYSIKLALLSLFIYLMLRYLLMLEFFCSHPFSSSIRGYQTMSSSNFTNQVAQKDVSSVFSSVNTLESGRKFQAKYDDVHLPLRMRSPSLPSTNGAPLENSVFSLDGQKRYK